MGGLSFFRFLARPPVDTYPLLAALGVGVSLAGFTMFNKIRNDPELNVNKANINKFENEGIQWRDGMGPRRTLHPQQYRWN
jgi:hypothetical protein